MTSWVLLLMVAAGIVTVLAVFYFALDPLGIRRQKDLDNLYVKLQKQLALSLDGGRWGEATGHLKNLPLNHALQKINPWLDGMQKIEFKMAARQWGEAYQLLTKLPNLPVLTNEIKILTNLL